jgi:hypothetical protein
MEANKAYFMVRAQVPSESERAKFDQWYGTHHLPLAMDTLHADKGWRFWSRSDPSVHYAMYEFKDMATLRKSWTLLVSRCWLPILTRLGRG